MATDTDEDWALISRRLSQVPERVAGYARCVARRGGGGPCARRPAGRPRHRAGGPDPAAVRRHGRRRRAATTRRCTTNCSSTPPRPPTPTRKLAAVLRDEIAPHARDVRTRSAATRTGCCRACIPRRRRRSRRDLPVGSGATGKHCRRTGVDCRSALSRGVGDRGAAAAGRRAALPGARHRRAAGVDAGPVRPRGGVAGRHALRHRRSRCATLECRIAPTQTGGIYYTGPSEDLTRPGRMWWSVPPGVDTFRTWQETTTVFHEGVPGPPPADRPRGRACRPAEPVAHGWAAGCRGTARGGRCTPSG